MGIVNVLIQICCDIFEGKDLTLEEDRFDNDADKFNVNKNIFGFKWFYVGSSVANGGNY